MADTYSTVFVFDPPTRSTIIAIQARLRYMHTRIILSPTIFVDM